jgi:hypothetical protein
MQISKISKDDREREHCAIAGNLAEIAAELSYLDRRHMRPRPSDLRAWRVVLDKAVANLAGAP